MGFRILTNHRQNLVIICISKRLVAFSNEIHLSPMDRFEPGVYILTGPVIKIHLRLQLGNIRNGTAAFPVVRISSVGEQHLLIVEIATLRLLAKRFEHPSGDWRLFATFPNCFKNTGFKNQVRVERMQLVNLLFVSRYAVRILDFRLPRNDGAAYVLSAGI